MENYKNLGNDSGVTAFEIGKDYILVQFKNHTYEYNYITPGEVHTNNMKSLARRGKGLNGYINKYVRAKLL